MLKIQVQNAICIFIKNRILKCEKYSIKTLFQVIIFGLEEKFQKHPLWRLVLLAVNKKQVIRSSLIYFVRVVIIRSQFF
jgi:hypothetical protein